MRFYFILKISPLIRYKKKSNVIQQPDTMELKKKKAQCDARV